MLAAGAPGLVVARPFSATTSALVDHHITIDGGHFWFGVMGTFVGHRTLACEAEGRKLNARTKSREARTMHEHALRAA